MGKGKTNGVFTPKYVHEPPGRTCERLAWEKLVPLLKRNEWLELTADEARGLFGTKSRAVGQVAHVIRSAVEAGSLPKDVVATKRGDHCYVCRT